MPTPRFLDKLDIGSLAALTREQMRSDMVCMSFTTAAADPVLTFLSREAASLTANLARTATQPDAVALSSKSRTTDAATSAPNPGDPADVLVRAIVASQAILAQQLEPQGMSADQAVALLLGVLDHEEVVRAVAETVRSAPPA